MPTASVHDSGIEQPADVSERARTGCRSGTAGCQAQQPALVELRRAGRPAELVVAVAPDVPDDEDVDGRRTGRRPTAGRVIGGSSQDRHRELTGSRLGRDRRGANRRGRPARRRPSAASRGSPRGRRRAAAAASRRPRRRPRPTASSASCSARRAARGRRGARAAGRQPRVAVDGAANSSTTPRWSGSSPSAMAHARRR